MPTSPRVFTLPRCCICLHRCVPLADYDAPVCVGCDLSAEALLARAELPPRAAALLNPPIPLPVALTRYATPRHTLEELTA